MTYQVTSKPNVLQFPVGTEAGLARDLTRRDQWDVAAHVRRTEQTPSTYIYGAAENHCETAFTLSLEHSSDNGVTDSWGARATGTITFADQPSDTDTVTIDDGSTSLVFEFDNNATITGDVAVAIGSTLAQTVANLIEAIKQNGQTLTPYLSDPATGDLVVTLVHDTVGTAGNNALAKSGADITVVGMTGGVALNALNLLVDGSSVASVVVAPGAVVEFLIPITNTVDEYLRFRAVSSEDVQGRVSLAYYTGDLHLWTHETVG